jgi:hypothetical protein
MLGHALPRIVEFSGLAQAQWWPIRRYRSRRVTDRVLGIVMLLWPDLKGHNH